jgi:hypothetical protein
VELKFLNGSKTQESQFRGAKVHGRMGRLGKQNSEMITPATVAGESKHCIST